MYSNEVKEYVLKLINEGKRVKDVSEITCVSIPTIYNWIKKDKETKKEVISQEKLSVPEASKIISQLIKEDKLTEAMELCKKYKRNVNVQVQNVIILIKLGKFQEALEFCNNSYFRNTILMQEQKIKILIELKRYDEAMELANKPELKRSNNIFRMKKKILPFCSNLDEIYTRIYIGNITLDEIKNSNVDDFKKDILIILYYEKNNLPGIGAIVKSVKTKYSADSEKTNILNKFYQRIQGKKSYLDYSIYSKYLKCNLRMDLINENNEKNQRKSEIIIKKEGKKAVDKKVVNKKQYKILTPVIKTKVVKSVPTVKVKKEKKVSVDISKIKIKDIFPSEIEDVMMYLYVEMNKTKSKKIIALYDRFCILIDKSISDINALNRFIDFVTCINDICDYVTIDVNNINVKKLRYIKPGE